MTILYTAPIQIPAALNTTNTTLKVIAVSGSVTSEIVQYDYVTPALMLLEEIPATTSSQVITIGGWRDSNEDVNIWLNGVQIDTSSINGGN